MHTKHTAKEKNSKILVLLQKKPHLHSHHAALLIQSPCLRNILIALFMAAM